MDSDMIGEDTPGDSPDDDHEDYFDHEAVTAVDAIDAVWHPASGRDYKPDRNAVEHMLALAANGQRDDDDFEVIFMRRLAAAILAAGGRGVPSEDRANDVLRACGLAGKYDEDRRVVEMMRNFRRAGMSVNDAIFTARELGHLGPEVSDETARKKLQRGTSSGQK